MEKKPLILNRRYKTMNQNVLSIAPGQMKNGVELDYRTVDIAYSEIPAREIQHFAPQLDYRTPTQSEHPLVINTPKGYFCIDGIEIINQVFTDKTSSTEYHEVWTICK
jgi:hypothetical protein